MHIWYLISSARLDQFLKHTGMLYIYMYTNDCKGPQTDTCATGLTTKAQVYQCLIYMYNVPLQTLYMYMNCIYYSITCT